MTIVRYAIDKPGQIGDLPARGTIECRPTKRRHNDDTIIVPASFTATLDADGVALLGLAPTGADWAWEITERLNRGKRRYVAVPDSPDPIAGTDLVDVDPTTLEPDAEPEASWWTSVDLLNTGVASALGAAADASEAATGAATLATTAAGTAATAAQVAADASQIAEDAAEAVEGKADATDLTALAGVVATKADASALEDLVDTAALAAAVAPKADQATVTAALATKIPAPDVAPTDGQLLRWDGTLGEYVPVNPVGAGRLATAINTSGTATPVSAAAGTGPVAPIALTAITVPPSGGRPVVIRYSAAYSQTAAGAGAIYLSLYETTGGANTFRGTFLDSLRGSSVPITLGAFEVEIGVVTTTRTFDLRAVLYTTATTMTASIANSGTYPTWIRAIAE